MLKIKSFSLWEDNKKRLQLRSLNNSQMNDYFLSVKVS
jgi:hypothetical protein